MRSFQELHLFATSKKEGLKKIKAWLDKYFTISQVHIQHELSSKEKKNNILKKLTVYMLTQIWNWKLESPFGDWTPCPSEPKLGNITTGLQRDSMTWFEFNGTYMHM